MVGTTRLQQCLCCGGRQDRQCHSDDELAHLRHSRSNGWGLGNTANCSNGGDNGVAAATFCGSNCDVNTLYDQSGQTNCGGSACNLTQATLLDEPVLTFNCVNTSLPCMTFSTSVQILSRASSPTQAQPFTYSTVWNNTSATCGSDSCPVLVSDSAVNYVTEWMLDTNLAVNVQATAASSGATPNNSYTLNTWNSTQAIFNSTSSAVYINGTSYSSLTGTVGTSGMANTLSIGNDTFAENFVGKIAEAGAWGSGFNSTQQSNMCHNQFAYWGTATSC